MTQLYTDDCVLEGKQCDNCQCWKDRLGYAAFMYDPSLYIEDRDGCIQAYKEHEGEYGY